MKVQDPPQSETIQDPPQSEGFRKYFSSVSWLLVERVFSMGVAFAISIYTANQLGAENFGKFNFARSFATIITVFAPLGMGAVMMRNLINHPEKKNLTLGTVFVTRATASLICIIVVGLVSIVFNHLMWHDDLKFLLVMIAAVPVIFESFNVLADFYNSRALAKYHVYGELTKTIVSAGVKLLLLFVFKASVIWFAVVLVMDAIIYDIVVVSIYRFVFKESPLQWKVDWSYSWEMIKQSLPLVLSGFVITVYMRLDQIMIGELLNDKEVGRFAAALRFSEATFFVPTVISNALLPAIIASKKESEERFTMQTQKLCDFLTLTGLAIAVGVNICSYWIFKYLYEPEYADAQNVLIIHVWSGVMVGMGMLANAWLIANNLQKYSLNRTIWGAIVNAGLNAVLIPKFGIEGAAIATLFSQAVASYLSNAITADTRPLFWMQTRSLIGFGFLSPIKDVLSGKFSLK
ncbi:flippase [Cytophagaceae bacterium DM2B3-1]|uniref:Flippase n=1 Tax=Xanthocytophaga flava TaxID=3048013 RepID=A0ABT7CPQ7_9BACT|nr:flippase [Xanthocytophaga flavus]MDJ1494649.1 flippase [Xanthocytophaga flavus]